jgi:hypothetical protein
MENYYNNPKREKESMQNITISGVVFALAILILAMLNSIA